MTQREARKAATRKSLEEAIERLQARGPTISISSVARAAGVTPAAIHNTYPDLAARIRTLAGKDVLQRDPKVEELQVSRARTRELRDQLARAQEDLRRLASINESLREDLRQLRTQVRGLTAN